ncbi:cell division protein ZapD, partial [Vibrio parahaemolyticus]|nr:cell division protein ZapD [Vibrio parahaemolyticus]
IHIHMNYCVYTIITRNKNRIEIKFMAFENGHACSQDDEFELAVCS